MRIIHARRCAPDKSHRSYNNEKPRPNVAAASNCLPSHEFRLLSLPDTMIQKRDSSQNVGKSSMLRKLGMKSFIREIRE